MKKAELELYTDYLISTFGATTASGLSAMVDGDVSHDRVTRFFSEAWIQLTGSMATREINRSSNRTGRRRIDIRRHHPGKILDWRERSDVLALWSLQWAVDMGDQLAQASPS
jgi:hypothetical protein